MPPSEKGMLSRAATRSDRRLGGNFRDFWAFRAKDFMVGRAEGGRRG